jgi:hypothetical protein
MNDKGYIYLKDVLSPDDTDYALSAYNGTLVDYPKMRDFIDNRFLPAVTRKIPYITDPHYVKFRFSDNNNSTDAAVVHRDVYNYTSEKSLPNLTVLCYFDDSEMELHEYSHGAFSTNFVTCYGTKKRIKMSKGDVLVFYSTMLHRGVKFGKSKHRRLLQVFDVYPTKEAYDKYFPMFCIVRVSKTTTKFDWIPQELAKFEGFIDTYNAFHFFLVYYDLQYKMTLNDLSPYDKWGKALSYESAKSMNFEDATQNPTNINIICDGSVCRAKPGRFYLYVVVTLLVGAYAAKRALATQPHRRRRA